MFSLLAVSRLQSEKLLSLNTLAATAFLMLLYNPLWLFDVGFQLSFVAVVSILLIQPKLYSLLSVRRCIPRYVWGLLTVSVAAQIGTAPLVIFYFSRFSTHFLLTNLWVIPMVTLILYSAVLMLVLTLFPFLQSGCALGVDALLSAQNKVLCWIEELPMSSIDRLWIDHWEIMLFYLFPIVSVSEFGYPNCSQHILSALLLVVADHLSYDFRQPVFTSARHCFL